MLQTLRSDNLVLSSDTSCLVVSRVAVMGNLNLSSDQEEADTKTCANVLQRNHGDNVCLWFPFGDTDIVLAVGLLQEFNDQVFIVNVSGSNKEHCKLNDFETDVENTSVLLDLHTITGNENKNVGSC